jgi:hypothetical protein
MKARRSEWGRLRSVAGVPLREREASKSATLPHALGSKIRRSDCAAGRSNDHDIVGCARGPVDGQAGREAWRRMAISVDLADRRRRRSRLDDRSRRGAFARAQFRADGLKEAIMAEGRYGPKGITLEELARKANGGPSCGGASVEPRRDRQETASFWRRP